MSGFSAIENFEGSASLYYVGFDLFASPSSVLYFFVCAGGVVTVFDFGGMCVQTLWWPTVRDTAAAALLTSAPRSLSIAVEPRERVPSPLIQNDCDAPHDAEFVASPRIRENL